MIFDTELLSEIQMLEHGGKELRHCVKNLLNKIGYRQISVIGAVPKAGKALIISNHPGVFDTLVLLSKVERDDFHFIALSTYGIFGKAVQHHLLPIYRQRKLNHKIYEYPLNLQIQGKTPEEMSLYEVRKRNRETINRAVELLDSHKSVSIFPTGSVGKSLKNSLWKPGVGYLISQSYDPNMQVIFAKITGTRKSDLVAYLRQPLRKIFFRPKPISITFSKTYNLEELVKKETPPKTITLELEKRYAKVWDNH